MSSCDDLLTRLSEIEGLSRTGAGENVDKAGKLALSIARQAPTGGIANLAMLVVSAASHVKREPGFEAARSAFHDALSRLRSALQERGKLDAATP